MYHLLEFIFKRKTRLSKVLLDNLLVAKKKEALSLIKKGHIKVDDKVVRKDRKMKPGKKYVIQKGKRQRITVRL